MIKEKIVHLYKEMDRKLRELDKDDEDDELDELDDKDGITFWDIVLFGWIFKIW